MTERSVVMLDELARTVTMTMLVSAVQAATWLVVLGLPIYVVWRLHRRAR